MNEIQELVAGISRSWDGYLKGVLAETQADYDGDFFRASSLGHRCPKYLAISKDSSMREEPSMPMLRRFALGHLFEGLFAEALDLANYEVETEVYGDDGERAGTLEFVVTFYGKRIGIDLKTTTMASPPTNVGELITNSAPYVRGYYEQALTYIDLLNLHCVILMFLDKTSGSLTACPVFKNEDKMNEIMDKLAVARSKSVSEWMDEKYDIRPYRECSTCPLLDVCIEGEGVTEFDFDSLTGEEKSLIMKMRILKGKHDEYEETSDRLKESLKRFDPGTKITGEKEKISINKAGAIRVKQEPEEEEL